MTSHERAVEIDTEIAETLERLQDIDQHLGWALAALHGALGEKAQIVREGRNRSHRVWPTTTSEAVEEGQRRAALAPTHTVWASFTREDWANRNIAEKVEPVVNLIETKAEASRSLSIASGLYDGWSRFFLVIASDGHIHRDRSCSTTFATTQWAWLPHLSGLDEDAAVKDQGPRLCSVCFPSAPVEWTLGLPKAPRCPGSGQRVEAFNPRSWKPYGRCPECGESFALSQTGTIRAHKPKKA